MAKNSGKINTELTQGRCDIKVWCQACERSDYISEGDKYLCTACGKIMVLDHEVHHEHFPHICGDEDNLS